MVATFLCFLRVLAAFFNLSSNKKGASRISGRACFVSRFSPYFKNSKLEGVSMTWFSDLFYEWNQWVEGKCVV
jgi:hypothetical protein